MPWPWAVNQDGASHFAASAVAAVAFVVDARARRARSIDVGCMQISLLHHPHAFNSLEDAFDPASNTAYAARFLSSLRDTTGSWAAAVAAYHSADPTRGGPYHDSVFAAWQGRADLNEATGLKLGEAAGSNRIAMGQIAMGRTAMGMHIWVSGDKSVLRVATRLGRLPAVITPRASPNNPRV